MKRPKHDDQITDWKAAGESLRTGKWGLLRWDEYLPKLLADRTSPAHIRTKVGVTGIVWLALFLGPGPKRRTKKIQT